jgi:hypothetical protein
MTQTPWQRLKQAIRERGWPGLALHVADRCLRRLHTASGLVCYRFLVQPLRAQARLPVRRGQHFAFRLLQRPEPVLAALGRPEAVLAQRFAQGAQCLLATREQALAGCIWFVHGRYREDELQVDYLLPPDCVWDFDVFVAPQERLGFLFARQWDALDARLRPLGTRYSISRVNALNRHSLASHRSLGACAMGWAVFLCLGRWRLMLSSLPPYLGLGGRPCLRMRV